mgnify:FL=1
MDKRLLFSAILAAGIGATEAQAQKVEAPTFPEYQLKLDGTDTVYVYNVKAQKWLVNGNAWGTQTSLGDKGMAVAIVPNKTDGTPNGTYTLFNNSADNTFKRKIFLNQCDEYGGNSYVDYGSQGIEKCNWEIYLKNDGKSFELQADTIANSDQTSNTRAGWNPNDTGKDGKNEDAKLELFRPALNMQAPEASEYGIEWLAVSREAYPICAARISLMNAINEASEEGLDLSKAITVYNDPNATEEELKAAKQYISDVRRNQTLGTATATDPVPLTDYITNANCDALDGWNHDCVYDDYGNVGSGGHGTNWQKQSHVYTATDGFQTGTFLERWIHAASNPEAGDKPGTGHLSDGYLSQTLTNLPAGAYKLSCYAMACQQDKGANFKVDGVTLFANTDSKENAKKVATDPGVPQKFEFMFEVKEGENLNFGLKLENTTANWLFVDEFQVEYYGADSQMMYLLDMQNEANTAYQTAEMLASAAYPGYIETVAELAEAGLSMDATSSQEDILAQKAKIQEAVEAMNTSAAKYAELQTLNDEVQAFLGDGDVATEAFFKLVDDCGNGTTLEDLALYNHTLDNAQLDEYMGKLKTELEESRKLRVVAGVDITYMITNPSFDTGTGEGWTGAKTVSKDNMNCESYQGTFDMYQEIEAPKTGVYEISAQAFHRVAANDVASVAYGNGSEDITAVLYANNLESKFASPYTYGMDAESGGDPADYKYTNADGKDVYIPNSMKGFAAACAENPEAYKTTVLVYAEEGEPIRLGVRETVRPSSNAGDWAIWDNFTAKFVGDDAAAINLVSAPVIAQGKELLGSKMNAEVRTALQNAISELETAGSVAGINAASVAIDAAKASIEAYKPLGTAIDAAQVRYESNETSHVTSDAAKAVYTAAKSAAEAAYDGAVADADVATAITALEKGVIDYIIYDAAKTATKENPVDISNVLVNPDFATMDKTGWTVKTGNFAFQAGNKVEAGEFFNCAFDVQQQIVGLPAGTYYLKSKAYYRDGNNANAYVDENETVKKYENNDNAFIYFSTDGETREAEEALKPIAACQIKGVDLNTYAALGNTAGLTKYVEGADDDESIWIPNDMTTAQAFFKSEQVGSKYETEPLKIVYDGKSAFYIGAYKDAKVDNDWTIIKSFTLEYAGYDPNEPVTAIKDIENAAGNATMGTKIYNAAGMLIGKLQRGINVVVTTLSDGSKKVSKIIMK